MIVGLRATGGTSEWLEHRLPRNELIHTHTELGDTMLPWAIGLAVAALAFAARELLTRRRPRVDTTTSGPGAATVETRASTSRDAPGGVALSVVLALLALIVAVGSVITVYRIGDSGARASWTGQFNTTELPRPSGEPGPPPGDG